MGQLRTRYVHVPIRKGFDPSHNPVQYPDFCDVSNCCAWSQCGKMLDDEMLGQLFLKRRVWTRTCRLRSNGTVKAKTCPCRISSLSWLLTRNIEALCSIFRSIHVLVQNCVTTRALIIFSWHLDHDRTTCRAVQMRSTDVVESQNFQLSKCSPVASHASTWHELACIV